MLAYYPAQWQWTEYLSEEQGRLLHTLAWLVRADAMRGGGANATHLGWLNRIGSDLLSRRTPYGGLQELLGTPGLCEACPPTSNSAYGDGEAPISQGNNDTVTDQLYSNNYALLALSEAWAATGNGSYGTAADALAAYLAATQAASSAFPFVSGSWPRAFHYRLWSYYGSSSDTGWGPWSVESGWTTTWIAAGMAMRALNTSLWDFLVAPGASGVDAALFAAVCPSFFGAAGCGGGGGGGGA